MHWMTACYGFDSAWKRNSLSATLNQDPTPSHIPPTSLSTKVTSSASDTRITVETLVPYHLEPTRMGGIHLHCGASANWFILRERLSLQLRLRLMAYRKSLSKRSASKAGSGGPADQVPNSSSISVCPATTLGQGSSTGVFETPRVPCICCANDPDRSLGLLLIYPISAPSGLMLNSSRLKPS
jgi:hypothetical protein